MRHLGYFTAAIAVLMADQHNEMNPFADMPLFSPRGGFNPVPFGSSKWSVAKDRRLAKKRAAVKRARRFGHA